MAKQIVITLQSGNKFITSNRRIREDETEFTAFCHLTDELSKTYGFDEGKSSVILCQVLNCE
jgi:hypothetical protein